MTFQGFDAHPPRFTPLPEQFFTELLPQIDDLDELRVTLYVLWRVARLKSGFPALQWRDLLSDDRFLQALAPDRAEAEARLQQGLRRAVARGTLLQAAAGEADNTYWLLNTPRGQQAAAAIERGDWLPSESDDLPPFLQPQQPNIFRLYEENIGPLTPLLADALREAEQEYPAAWIRQAFEIAVERNVRNWRYVEAILRRWKEEGRDEREDSRYSEEDRRKYVQGRYADLFE